MIPAPLKAGDTIAIVSTARKISAEECQSAIEFFKQAGFNVRLGKSIGAQHNQYAGNDALRADDFQTQLNDPKVHAIFCARGGYGTVRIIDNIDFRAFIKKPKWIAGYSDVTVLHSHVNKVYDVATLHCSMPINFPTNTAESMQSIISVLNGNKHSYKAETTAWCRSGKAEGQLCGGNLSLLYALSNSDSDIDTDGKILFIEDIDEYLYHIDRMMMQLKRSGKLENLAGLIVGQFTDMKDNETPYGSEAYDIIAEHVSDYDYPVWFNFPAGHVEDNRALVMGATYKMYPENENMVLKML
jgi:muramoyltetrapeptide carboxypeptidase